MARISVSTGELKAVGRRVEGVGEGVAASPGTVAKGLPDVSEPPATSAALDDLKTEWEAGLRRLADDVRSLGQLTVAVAHIYEKVDNDQFVPVER